MLRKLEAEAAPGWPVGVYFHGDDLYRIGLVVVNELPRDRSTLLVRIMAAGPVLPGALADLAALPEDAHERAVAEQILVRLQHVIGKKPGRTPEEEELIVSLLGASRPTRRGVGPDPGGGEVREKPPLRACKKTGPSRPRRRKLAKARG